MPDRDARGAGEHPSLMVVSLYVDGTLDDRERAEFESHLAACEDCYELVTGMVASEAHIDAVGLIEAPVAPRVAVSTTREAAAAPPNVVPFVRRRWTIGAAIGLAVAASVLMVFIVDPGFRRRLVERNSDAAMAQLIAAIGAERAIDGRLSGGFPYAPVQTAARSDRANLALAALEQELADQVDEKPSVASRHALALTHLCRGAYDVAISELARLATEHPSDARYKSDLAAAYIARGLASMNVGDLQQAATAADAAIAADSGLVEAWFNRALAIQNLQPDQGAAAWSEYLARDGNSLWSVEGRQRAERSNPRVNP